MPFKFNKQLTALILIILSTSIHCQISNDGQPYSFFNVIKSEPVPNLINAPTLIEINNAVFLLQRPGSNIYRFSKCLSNNV